MYEPVAMATVPQTEDTFTAAHAAQVSAQAQAETARRLQADLVPLLAECQRLVNEAAAAGLTAVDVPLLVDTGPDLRLALSRALQARGFDVNTTTKPAITASSGLGKGVIRGGLTLGWQPAATPRPPAYRTGQAVQPPGFPLPRRDLLRETPEEVGPPE